MAVGGRTANGKSMGTTNGTCGSINFIFRSILITYRGRDPTCNRQQE